MSVWPITIKGEIYPGHGIPTQWAIGQRDKSEIGQLPLNPYDETCGTRNQPKSGIPITCKYKNVSVVGQFHRKPKNKDIWIYTNRSNDGTPATDEWYKFLSSFEITKGSPHEDIQVYLDFYPNLVVVIRL